MEKLWRLIDVISCSGGKATIDTLSGRSLKNPGVGGTLGYQINGNMQLNLSYSATVNNSNPEDLKMDGFRMTRIFGWHKLVEGMNRLNSHE